MGLPSHLLLTGGAIYTALGAAHALWSILDVQRPRRFAPSDRHVQEAMVQSTVRLTRGRTTMWDAWLGFNISHGLGALIFGALAMTVGAFHAGLLATPLVLSAIVSVSLAYFVLAVRFWFYVPIVCTGLATACFAGALGYTLLVG
jgi:hypothetical protein